MSFAVSFQCLRLNETKLFGHPALSLDLFIYNESFQKSLKTPSQVSLALKVILVCFNIYWLFTIDSSSALFHLLLENIVFMIIPALLFIT
jgi:hypothetical protein